MIELIMLFCGVAGAIGAARNGGGGARSANGVDSDERAFIKKYRGRHSDGSLRRYLDAKRESIGRPRRPGVNSDLLSQLGDD